MSDEITTRLLSYGGLFLWSFLAATVLPLGSEVALAALVRSEGRAALPVVVATLGNYLGACTTYWLGRRAAEAVGRRRGASKCDARAARLLARYGQPALLLSWVPLLGDALVALAGGMGLPFGAFSLWVLAGKALRYWAVAWAASSL